MLMSLIFILLILSVCGWWVAAVFIEGYKSSKRIKRMHELSDITRSPVHTREEKLAALNELLSMKPGGLK